ncbi:MAG TPA: hypothetical protein VGW33_06085 [Terriglobia bacterium]|nr:hypothetical protein [Terriglobia bacterium]
MRKNVFQYVPMMAGLAGLAGLLPVGRCRAQSQAPTSATAPQAQSQAVQQPSLGEVARRLRAKREQSGEKAVKVYTNDDLKSGSGGISVVGPGPAPPASTEARGGSEGAAAAKRDEQYYREKASQLQAKLQMHERELAVLQQKLNLNQMQYYNNPNETLRQEYSRGDINKLTAEIAAKKAQVEEDQKAVAALDQQVRREGGDPGWLRGPASAQAGAAGAPHAPTAEPHTREEWQQALKEAKARLARAKEEQQLAEDELTLLQTQEARELATGANETAKITDKKAEVEAKRAATEKAQKELDDLERKFQQSGAPE